jgi:hypothetical protein
MTRSELHRAIYRLTRKKETGIEYFKVDEDLWEDGEMTLHFTGLSEDSTEEVTSTIGG